MGLVEDPEGRLTRLLLGSLESPSASTTTHKIGMGITYLLALHENILERLWSNPLLGLSHIEDTCKLHGARRRRRSTSLLSCTTQKIEADEVDEEYRLGIAKELLLEECHSRSVG